MFRCNQCSKRHLSVKHFSYSPYLCKICKKSDQFHLTATEEDVNKHFEAMHPGTRLSITLSREKSIEDKIIAAINEYQLPTLQNISLDIKNESHQECYGPSNQSNFSATGIESGSISSHVTQERNNGETIENAVVDDIGIAFETVSQKIKNEASAPNDIMNGFKNDSHRECNVPSDQSPFATTGTESESISSHVKQNNGEIVKHLAADDMSNATQSRAQLNSVVVSDETFNQIDEENIRQDFTPNGQSTAMPLPSGEENVIQSEQNTDEEFNEHDATDPAIQMQGSSNNSEAKLIQRKRSLPLNDCHSRLIISAKRSNPKNTNSKEKIYKCNHCSYASARKDNLERHVRIHTGEKPYKCYKCPYASTQSTKLKEHTRTCTQKGSLDIHMRIHTGEKPYKCGVCSYASVQSSALKKHTRTHIGEKPFKCSICSYACATNRHLKYHVSTHTGEKPYKCDKCPYASSLSGTLMTHMRIHTGEKPFKCSICSFASAARHSLDVHMRTHTGEKPYKCFKCAFAGIQSSHLQDHVRRHHYLE